MPFVEMAFVNTFRAMLGATRHRPFMAYWLDQAAHFKWLSPLFDHQGQMWRIGSLGLAQLASAQGSKARPQIDAAIARHPKKSDLGRRRAELFAYPIDDIGRTVLHRFSHQRTPQEQSKILFDAACHESLASMLSRLLFVNDDEDLTPWLRSMAVLPSVPQMIAPNAVGLAAAILRVGAAEYVSCYHPNLCGSILGQCLVKMQFQASNDAMGVIDSFPEPENAVLVEVYDKLSLSEKFIIFATTYGGFSIHQIETAFAIKNWYMARGADPECQISVEELMEAADDEDQDRVPTVLESVWREVFESLT